MDAINKLLGAQKPMAAPASAAADDSDFADFAHAPDPSPVSILAATPSAAGAGSGAYPTAAVSSVPYTKWYRVWERTSPGDFKQEAIILPFIILAVLLHLWGSRSNRRIAKKWSGVHASVLKQEYAVIGFGEPSNAQVDESVSAKPSERSVGDDLKHPDELLKEKSASEFSTYATGRANAAFTEITLTLLKRFNPLVLAGEYAVSFFLESFSTPVERIEATTYAFDGQEAELVPPPGDKTGQEFSGDRKVKSASGYDGFVWAIVHKDVMKQLRDERYDVSITSTKDNAKLPSWATVMSENAEITEIMLTQELISAVESAGECLEYLIISDQPLNKPLKLNDTIPTKRLLLSMKCPSSDPEFQSTLPLFTYFLRLPDMLVTSAHFRPEVIRKLRATREEQIRKLQRAVEDEKAEERSLKKEKEKKEKRETKLNSLSADEQRKFLEKERQQDAKKGQKRMTQKG